MTVEEAATRTRPESPHQVRARYHTSENPFRFGYAPVPARQFLDERDRAFAVDTPTGAIALDASDDLGVHYPATTPTLLCRYLNIRAGDSLHAQYTASGAIYYVMAGQGESHHGEDRILWSAGDLFCFPGGDPTIHRAANTDCLLFVATDEPLLSFGRLRPPAARDSVVETVHWPVAEIERHFEGVYRRAITADTTGCSVMFSTRSLAPGYMTIPSINVAINTLAAGGDQRAHRHNGVAVTLALQGEGVHSMIENQRIDWSTGAAQITPATLQHSHHNRGAKRMRSLVIQDEGLHYYTRTPGFSFV
ncbi:MAG: cupin domain-containing protein [Burkholderiales bacterium]